MASSNKALEPLKFHFFLSIVGRCGTIKLDEKGGRTMSEMLEKMKTRRSNRAYTSQEVPMELVEKIVEAGTYAPSGRGLQSSLIVAVTNREVRDQLAKMNADVMGVTNDPFYGAPVVLVVLADKKRPTYLYDGSVVMENMLLAAHDLGLGSCWIHRAKEVFESEEGQALLEQWGIEGDYEGIGNCIIGYPSDEPQAKPRKENYVIYVR